MLIFAHRGYSSKFPENSLMAFRKAFEVGADGIELDVRLTKDGKLIVFHDADMKRIFGLDRRGRDMDYSDIEKLRFFGEKVSTLEEVLNIIPQDKWLIVEVKEFDAGEAAAQLVIEKGLKGRTIFSSFDHDLIKELKYHHPRMNFAFLIGEEHSEIDRKELISYIIKTHPHSVHIPKDAFDLFPEEARYLVNLLKENGIDVYLWNTNDLDFVRKNASLFDGVIVDEVEKFVEWKKGVKV
jgi:glycerophosphoryl diester phosphodiesterase